MQIFGQRATPVVKNIIIINVIMVLIQFALGRQGIDLGNYLGLHYWKSPNFHWWQILTHIFMHGSPYDISLTIGHIFFNMYGVYMFGTILENIWGPKRFLFFYMVCGIGAGLCHLAVLNFEFTSFFNSFLQYQQHPSYSEFVTFIHQHKIPFDMNQPFMTQWQATSGTCVPCNNESIRFIHEVYSSMINENTVGASGAVFGILFAFAYLFPNTALYIMFIPVPVKAKWVVAVYAGIELFSGIGQIQGDNVAHFAHLGGMLFAFILLRLWKNNRSSFY